MVQVITIRKNFHIWLHGDSVLILVFHLDGGQINSVRGDHIEIGFVLGVFVEEEIHDIGVLRLKLVGYSSLFDVFVGLDAEVGVGLRIIWGEGLL